MTLFSIAYYYKKHFITKGTEADFAKTFLSFEQERKEDLIKPRDARNDLLINYQEAIAKSTLSQKSVSGRYLAVMSFYQEHLLEPPLRYPQRHFTEEQRLFIYRRDHGICQLQIKCQGKKCGWEEWHTDHIKPHSKGGQTTVENGQVSCPECNFVKGDMAID